MFPDLAPHVAHAAPHVAPHVAHVVAHVKPVIQTIHTGVPMLYTFISSVVSLSVGFGLGWYIKGRGMAGVKIDLANVKNDIVNLQAKLSAPTVAA